MSDPETTPEPNAEAATASVAEERAPDETAPAEPVSSQRPDRDQAALFGLIGLGALLLLCVVMIVVANGNMPAGL